MLGTAVSMRGNMTLPGEPHPAGRSPHFPCRTAPCDSKRLMLHTYIHTVSLIIKLIILTSQLVLAPKPLQHSDLVCVESPMPCCLPSLFILKMYKETFKTQSLCPFDQVVQMNILLCYSAACKHCHETPRVPKKITKQW